MKKLLLIVAVGVLMLLAAACTEVEELQSSLEQNEMVADGQDAYNAGDYEAAIVEWKAAFAVEGDSEVAWNLSTAYAQLGEEEAALEWLHESLKLSVANRLDDKELAPLQENEEFKEILVASDYLATGQWPGKSNSDPALAYYKEAWDKYMAEEYEESLELWHQAFKLDPMNDNIAFSIACVSSLLGNEAEALEWLRTNFRLSSLRILEDHDLDAIRDTTEFGQISSTLRKVWE